MDGQADKAGSVAACGQAAIGVTVAKHVPGCGMCEPPPAYLPVAADAPYEGAARVVAVRGLDLYQMTREALRGVGGIGAIVQPGETVFIKPNFGGLGWLKSNTITGGESTKPEIVAVVAEECLKAGAATVIIGEGGQARVIDWPNSTTLDGATNLVLEAQRLNATYPGRVSLASLMTDSPAWDPLPSPHTGLGTISVSSLLASADRVISIAPIKTHRWTHITGTMKNFVGVTSFDQYGGGMNWRYPLHQAAGGVSQCFLDIVAALRPDLAILDGSIGCEGNGPHVMPGVWGTTVNVKDRIGWWFLLAGTDLAAVDATAARIIGQDPESIPFLSLARDQGLGQIGADKIEFAGATLADLQMEWQPAEHLEGFCEVILPGALLQFGG